MNKIIILVTLMLTSCASYQGKESFNTEEINWFVNGKGKYKVQGESFARRNNGNIVTCAGLEVSLVPVSKYSTERINSLYGNDKKGRTFLNLFNRIPEGEKAYYENRAKVRCDSRGQFKFTNIPQGEYYLISFITIQLDQYSSQNLAMFEKLNVKEDLNGIILN